MPMFLIHFFLHSIAIVCIQKIAGSFEQSPRLINQYQEYMGSDEQAIAPTDTQLREDLADAMRESPRDSGKSIRFVISHICY